MLGWIFKKTRNAPGQAAVAAQTIPLPDPSPSAASVDWAAKLTQADNDDAVLAVLRSADMPLQFKQAAVEALDGEAALRQAEREFRNHDRRVHQLAKRRLSAKVAQRQAREQAASLIETARRLVGEADVPVNRCVELDHAWRALDVTAIDPAQRDEFEALAARLVGQVRQRTDIELKRTRWKADAVRAQLQLQAACADAAAGLQDRAWLARAVGATRALLDALTPEDAAVLAADRALIELGRTLKIAQVLDDHLVVLDRLLGVSAETAAASIDGLAAGTGAGEDPRSDSDARTEADQGYAVTAAAVDDPEQEWQALAPLPDTQLAALLHARHARWQEQRHDRESQRREQARASALERQRGRTVERSAEWADLVTQAEAALDAGKLADAQHHLGGIDQDLQGLGAPEALRARILAAQARLAQLQGWQHWAGGRARDELVLQAEALAAATAAAGEADGALASNGASEIEAEVARLSIRQRAEVIASLRARWKEINLLGGPGGRALWRRFDAALKAAGEPVAIHAAAQQAARESNLSARRQLLDVLEAVVVAPGSAQPVDAAGLPGDAAPSQSRHEAPPESPVDARTLATALDRFHVEWRKLGPIEHTVPRPALGALVARMEAAVGRVEAPLQLARHRAGAEREALVARARALADSALGRERDLVREVRTLQEEWQHHAKALSLGRAQEQALWTAFKTSIDAVFAARQAQFSAREAEYEAHAATRTALIGRLQLRPEDSPLLLRRTLAEVDAAWSQCGPAPRARAAALDSEYRAAREALRQHLHDVQQREWQATCDALEGKLALCRARERGAEANPEELARSWQALSQLPAPLEEALRQRAGLVPASGPDSTSATDDLLLQIEAEWDLPTPPPFESARRERKLLAMKAALEGHRAGTPATLSAPAALARLLGRSGLDAGQNARLDAILAAWRRRGLQHPVDHA